MRLALAGAALISALAFAGAVPAQTVAAPDAETLPTGWTLKPAGRQLELGTFPVRSLLSPDGKYLVVLHAGYEQPSLRVFSTKTFTEVDRTSLDDAWRGMSFAPETPVLYVSGGATGNVYEFRISDEGKLESKRTFSIVPRGQALSRNDFVGDVQVSPDGRLIYAAALFGNEIRVINPQSGWLIEQFPSPRLPYRILPHPDGETFFLTSWAEGSVHRIEAANGNQLYRKGLGLQPMDMVWRRKAVEIEEDGDPPPWIARLFVATAATNMVHVLGLTSGGDLLQLESVNISMWPWQPLGMTPTSLALSPDESLLYVVCSDANAVAVVDVSRVKSRVLGFVPTGWYPTDVTPLPDGRVLVLNGKGNGSKANPDGPNPLTEPVAPRKGSPHAGYIAATQTGTASIIDATDEAGYFAHTQTALALSPYRDEQLVAIPEIPAGNPIPPGPRVPAQMESPIKHVLYIVKENRSYDQVLGDIGGGNSDPKLTVFGEDVTPNHHKLARAFVLFDNFRATGDVDADGRYWATAAIAAPFVQLLWPSVYAGRLPDLDISSHQLAAAPPAGFLWTQARQAGLEIRNYGFAVVNHERAAQDGTQIKQVLDPGLDTVTEPTYRGFDLDYRDVDRAKAFLDNLTEMDAANAIPRLMVMRLGNDHTSGITSGKIAPRSAMADNDLALGMIVEGCSKTKVWSRMAIFVVEDDASGGGDHVDAHRSIALAISPYTRRGILDSNMYNSTSVLRTIELILGLNPMTQFDAAAMPMWSAFGTVPDNKPYVAVQPKVPLNERNP